MTQHELRLLVTAIDKASSVLRSVGKAGTELTGKLRGLGTAASVAGGIMIAEMIRGATSFAQEAIVLSGRIDTLANSFAALSKSQGITTINLEKLRDATRGTISDIDLLKAANQALLLNIPFEEFDKLSAAAVTLGHAMGIDAKYAIESLTIGIGRQSRLILDNLGIVFSATDAYEWYAQQLGKSTAQLTESEKRLGWQSYAIEQVMKKSQELGDVTSKTQLAQEQWNASIKNLQTSMGDFLNIFQPILPALNTLMPMLGTMAGVLLPKLITRTNLLSAAEKLYSVAKAVSNKQTYVSIAAHLKDIAAIAAHKVATLAAKAATWLLNAALTVKIGLITFGIGVIAAATAATIAWGRMTAMAADAESDLGASLTATSKAAERNAETMRYLNEKVEESGHTWYRTATYIDAKIVELEAAHRLLMIETTADLKQIALAYEEAWRSGRFREAAETITDFAATHNLTFEQAEEMIKKYSKSVVDLVDQVESAAEKFQEEWRETAAANSASLDEIARAFSNAFSGERFIEAARLIEDFAESHQISFSKAEDIVRSYAETVTTALSEYEKALQAIRDMETGFLTNQEAMAQAESDFTASLENEWRVLKAGQDEYLPKFAAAFKAAFDVGRLGEATAAVSAFASKHQIAFESARNVLEDYLDSISASDLTDLFGDIDLSSIEGLSGTLEGLLTPLEELAVLLEHESNLLKASATDVLPQFSSAFKEAFGKGQFQEAANVVEEFSSLFQISLEEALDTLKEFTPASVEPIVSLVDEINTLIKAGLVGEAQDSIQEFVECSTGKQADMVAEIGGYLDDLRKEYETNLMEIAWLQKTGNVGNVPKLMSENVKLQDTMRQLSAWQAMLATQPGFNPAAETNVTVHGPILTIQGSADRATADRAARLVLDNLRNVVVESTSSASSVVTSRIRVEPR